MFQKLTSQLAELQVMLACGHICVNRCQNITARTLTGVCHCLQTLPAIASRCRNLSFNPPNLDNICRPMLRHEDSVPAH